MSIIAKKLRESVGHPDARCTNRQKTFHDSESKSLKNGRTAKKCHCGQWYSLPTCHASRHKSCSDSCAQAARDVIAAARTQACGECGKAFIPRPNQLRNGGGKFCSIPCSLMSVRRLPAFLESRPKAVETLRRNGYKPPCGPENKQWTGGPKETQRRRKESGAAVAQVRSYRERNPEMVREWAQNRRNRKAGRLAYGTIPKLMVLQRGLCAYCQTDIRERFHVDHVMPLARGGKHESTNVQLLCASCNLTKSDRDPITFAQLNGRLL